MDIVLFVSSCSGPVIRELRRNLDNATVDIVDDVVWWASVNGASYTLGGAEDLLAGAFQLAGHASLSHCPGNGHDVVEGDIAAVFD